MLRVSFASATTPFLVLLGLSGCRSDQDVGPASLSTDCLVRGSAANGQAIAGQYLVTARTTPNPSLPNARRSAHFQDLLSAHGVANPTAERLVDAGTETTFLTELQPAEALALQNDPAVLRLEPDRIVSVCACVDVAAPATLPWNVQQTGYGRGDRQTDKTVWVVDTGIDLDHPDLNVDTGRSRSFLRSASPTAETPGADDRNGHGTHVAGIIGALNNGIGVTGIASGARLVALKVLDQLGEGRLSGVIAAVQHVAANGRAGDVVNLSLGGEGQSPTLDRVIRAAADRGILFAIAAGNEGESVEGQSPAGVNHPNVFTVSALDRSDRLAPFSNFGPSVDVAAYGVGIASTYRDGRYATLSGTSMAAPHVAGLLLIRGRNLPTRGTASGDRDDQPDLIARQ